MKNKFLLNVSLIVLLAVMVNPQGLFADKGYYEVPTDNRPMMDKTNTLNMKDAVTMNIKMKEAKFACPMHPEVTSDQPGKCYKCGMKLKPIKKEILKDKIKK